MPAQFDAAAEVKKLKAQAKIRRRPGKRSRLLRHQSQLLAMHAAGASIADLQRWLRSRHISVAHSTVSRWIRKNG